MSAYECDDDDKAEAGADINDATTSLSSVMSTIAISSKKKKKKKKKTADTTTSTDGTTTGSTTSNNIRFHSTRPIVIKQTANSGRCLMSTKVISAGTVVFREKAIGTVTYGDTLCVVCNKLLVPTDKGCDSATVNDKALHLYDCYCSKQCQSSQTAKKYVELEGKHINDYQYICSKYDSDVNLIRMISKILCYQIMSSSSSLVSSVAMLLNDDGDVITSTVHGLDALESHIDQQSCAWKTSIASTVEDLLQLNTYFKDRFTVEYLVELAAKINTNGYGIVDPINEGTNSAIGFALFPAVGLCINHSCYPNLYFSYNSISNTMDYRALCDIDANVELTVSYINTLQPIDDRRRSLQASRFFHCLCSRCKIYDEICLHIVNANDFTSISPILNETLLLASSLVDANEVSGSNSKSCSTKKMINIVIPAKNTLMSSILSCHVPVTLIYADLYLNSINCSSCDYGCIISIETALCSCINCGSKKISINEMKTVTETAKGRWQSCNTSLQIETFLNDYDPSSSTSSSTSSLQSRRYRKLHSNNVLIMQAYELFGDALASTRRKDDVLKAISYHERYYNGMKECLPRNHPATAAAALLLHDTMQILIHNNPSIKDIKGLKSKAIELKKLCYKIRCISLGTDHPLTISVQY